MIEVTDEHRKLAQWARRRLRVPDGATDESDIDDVAQAFADTAGHARALGCRERDLNRNYFEAARRVVDHHDDTLAASQHVAARGRLIEAISDELQTAFVAGQQERLDNG